MYFETKATATDPNGKRITLNYVAITETFGSAEELTYAAAETFGIDTRMKSIAIIQVADVFIQGDSMPAAPWFRARITTGQNSDGRCSLSKGLYLIKANNYNDAMTTAMTYINACYQFDTVEINKIEQSEIIEILRPGREPERKGGLQYDQFLPYEEDLDEAES